MLNIRNITVQRGGKKILNEISFKIHCNDVLCILGSNGVGKSTLLKSILGKGESLSGESYFEEYNLMDKNSKSAFHEIGVLFNNSFYLHLSAKENLEIRALLYNLPRNRIQDAISLANLSDFVNSKAYTYSSGQKQRLNLAITFLHKPKLVILDEPFIALDPETINYTIEFIKKTNKEFGTTYIITSHTLNDIEKIYSRLMILKSSKIIFDSNKSEINNLYTYEVNNENLLLAKLKKTATAFISKREKTIFLSSEQGYYEDTSIFYQKATIEDVYLILNNNEKTLSI